MADPSPRPPGAASAPSGAPSPPSPPPRYSPPTTYGEAARPLKGILKNSRRSSSASGLSGLSGPDDETEPLSASASADAPPGPPASLNATRPAHVAPDAVPYCGADGRLHWDESNLASNEWWKENTAPRMKVDEPKTPFVQGTHSMDLDLDDVDENFTLDNTDPSDGSPVPPAPPPQAHPVDPATEAELTRINTEANKRLGHASSAPHSASADYECSGSQPESSEKGRSSRSPSFSLPNGQRALVGRRMSSTSPGAAAGTTAAAHTPPEAAAAATAASPLPPVGLDAAALRAANGGGSGGLGGSALSSEYGGDSESEEAEPRSEEEQRKHAMFEAKRKGHYGNEADALKRARELLDQESDDDEEEEEDERERGRERAHGQHGDQDKMVTEP